MNRLNKKCIEANTTTKTQEKVNTNKSKVRCTYKYSKVQYSTCLPVCTSYITTVRSVEQVSTLSVDSPLTIHISLADSVWGDQDLKGKEKERERE